MLLTYKECIDRYGSDYKLKKEIGNGALFVREKGYIPPPVTLPK